LLALWRAQPTRSKDQSGSIIVRQHLHFPVLPRFSPSPNQTSTGPTHGHEANGGIRHELFTTIALMRSFAE
jgi:hypothetical protein